MSRLALSDAAADAAVPAPWIGPLLALGTKVARYMREQGRQLIIALSVPRRDFAAALIGCGWVMASDAPVLDDPLETLRSVQPGTPIRAVNDQEVIQGAFGSLDESVNPPRAHFGGSRWRVDLIRALSVMATPAATGRMNRPQLGSVGKMAGLDRQWDARLVAPAADLAIVGTAAWLKDDFEAYIGREGDPLPPMAIRNILLPNIGSVATWFTRVYSSAGLAEKLPLPRDLRTVILDGTGAIKYLGEIESSAVICILDRSVADETAAEMLVQMRNTRGEPISVRNDLGWPPPVGVEAMSFTVPL